jgi:hypothetical protein
MIPAGSEAGATRLSHRALLLDIADEPGALRQVHVAYSPGGDGRRALEAIPIRPHVLYCGMGSSYSAARDATKQSAQGLSSEREAARVERHLRAFPILRLETLDDFVLAAELYRSAGRAGVTIRKALDCLIAAPAFRGVPRPGSHNPDYRALGLRLDVASNRLADELADRAPFLPGTALRGPMELQGSGRR